MSRNLKTQKFIFITGGVVSGLGKGISGSSIANILKNSGYKVFMQKLDPYLNVDPGTMNPFEHGEVFVTGDGAETDLDLGHYERFIDTNTTQQSNVTSGRIYQTVIANERQGYYEGRTIQVVPHITNEIKRNILNCNPDADIIVTEIGGTVGDIESLPFIEAIRQLRFTLGAHNVMIIHVGLVPYIKASHESKTKPIQHSVKTLLSLGLQPDCIVARTSNHLTPSVIRKISLLCNVTEAHIIIADDAPSIYEVPLRFNRQKAGEAVADVLHLPAIKTDMSSWERFVEKINNSHETVEVCIVGKYTKLPDAYISIIEALNIAGYENHHKIKIHWIESSLLTSQNYIQQLTGHSAILIPGGFGSRGIEGMILAAKYAREHKIPYLGICLGMQIATIEFIRNVCHQKGANSTEFDKQTPVPIFDIIRGKSYDDALGGTLRLGNYINHLTPGSLSAKLYGGLEITERHRHRFELNNKYIKLLEQNGMDCTGIWKEGDLVEIVEIKDHPFFIGTQFHSEFTSRPNRPNPLFNGFIQAIIKNRK